MNESILIQKSLQFSLDIINLYYEMIENNEFIISKQLLKSSTSIGANVKEAKFAESINDFIHKLKISQKECSETLYWLELIRYSYKMDYKIDHLYSQGLIIMKMICNSIKTCQDKRDIR